MPSKFLNLDTDGTFTANSDERVASQKAIKTYTDNKVSGYLPLTSVVTSISSSSTDSQVPTAKCMYDIVGDIETLLGALL